MDKPDFAKYYRYDELTELLQAYERQFAGLASVESIGKSYESRDVWALTISNQATGDALEKPGFYVDGNIHGSEVTASVTALYFAWSLLSGHGEDEALTRLVDETTFYIIPAVSPVPGSIPSPNRRPAPWPNLSSPTPISAACTRCTRAWSRLFARRRCRRIRKCRTPICAVYRRSASSVSN